MKDTVNLNDVRRMKQLIASGATAQQLSARLHIVPELAEKWYANLTAPPVPPSVEPAPAVGDVSAEAPAARPRPRRKG